MPLLSRVADAVTSWEPATPADVALRRHTLDLLAARGDAAVTRALPEHVTASALVLSADLTRTLLCFHRKGRFWVQPGGHLDPTDDGPLGGALRELAEETGVTRSVRAVARPSDVDRHRLGDGFGRCAWHVDVGFAVVADPTEPLALSAESTDVAWWPVDDLPTALADRVAERVHRARAMVTGLPGGLADPGAV